MPGGRPTKYKHEYCEMLIDHMSNGLSYETFSAVIGVSRAVLYDWEKAYPEFLDAKKEAFDQCQLFWEKEGAKGLWNETHYNDQGKPTKSKSLNSTVWIFNMKNRFNWSDKREVKEDSKQTIKLAYSLDDDDEHSDTE